MVYEYYLIKNPLKTRQGKHYTKNKETVILVILGSIKLRPKIFFSTELEFAFANKDAFVY